MMINGRHKDEVRAEVAVVVDLCRSERMMMKEEEKREREGREERIYRQQREGLVTKRAR